MRPILCLHLNLPGRRHKFRFRPGRSCSHANGGGDLSMEREVMGGRKAG